MERLVSRALASARLIACALLSPAAQVSKAVGLELYKDMYMGRAFEDMCAQARAARRRAPGAPD